MSCISPKVYNGNVCPCGKCGFCLVKKRTEWVFRIHQEMRTQDHRGYFLTFTYDERHVRRTPSGKLSLRFYDVQLYLKRLRKAKYYAKYICVGEYGGSTARPHYHMLLWTDAPTSFIESNWKSSTDGSQMGMVHFGHLTMASAMYSLKYILQPKVKFGENEDRESCRAQFSKGIGIDYLGYNFKSGYRSSYPVVDWHGANTNHPKFYGFVEGKKQSLPRYYRNKLFGAWERQQYAQEMFCESIQVKAEKIRKTMKLLKCGVLEARRYLRKLDIDKSEAIIKKTKHNQTL